MIEMKEKERVIKIVRRRVNASLKCLPTAQFPRINSVPAVIEIFLTAAA